MAHNLANFAAAVVTGVFLGLLGTTVGLVVYEIVAKIYANRREPTKTEVNKINEDLNPAMLFFAMRLGILDEYTAMGHKIRKERGHNLLMHHNLERNTAGKISYRKNGEFVITLDSKNLYGVWAWWTPPAHSLAHEMVHARQVITKRLGVSDAKGYSVWEGKEYKDADIPYADQPWEKEAVKVSKALYREWRRWKKAQAKKGKKSSHDIKATLFAEADEELRKSS